MQIREARNGTQVFFMQRRRCDLATALPAGGPPCSN
jgi:hypothetical protein